MSNEFLEKRHASMEVSEETIFDLVKKATGKTAQERNRIVAGFDNEVYDVATDDRNYIVRIARFGEVPFSQEEWAIGQCQKADVPVPEILFNDKIDADGRILEAMVMSKLEGQSLRAVIKKLQPKELDDILRQAGAILGNIHSIKVDGFYQRHIDGSWDFPDWDAMLDANIKDRLAEKSPTVAAGFDERAFEFMIESMRRYKIEFPCKSPVLNHGDYLPEHIFVDDKLKVSGIIDFGMFQGAPPVYDFAFFSFEEPNLNLEALKDGYQNKAVFGGDFTTELNLHKIGLEMGHLAYQSKIGNRQGVEFITRRLRQGLVDLGYKE